MKKICVLGLGYIGLPTAAMFAAAGHQVVGVDVNAEIVSVINRGEIHIKEPHLAELVKDVVASGNLRAQSAPETAEAFIIAVPTPFTPDKKGDVSYVRQAAESIVPHLRKGSLVILESTVPPRTTIDVLLPLLLKSGLRLGAELLVAFCPERVLPGKILEELVHNNRVMGGIDDCSAVAAQELYATFVKGEMYLTDATTAEMTKLMENTFRDVNIALANEFALISERIGVNVWDAILYANKHPRVNIHQPGPGVGGHCIAVDPWFIVESVGGDAPLITLSRKINDSMPEYVVQMVKHELRDVPHPKVAVLGITYKANVDDCRESPAMEVLHHLEALDYNLGIYDPLAQDSRIVPLAEALFQADLILLLVNHDDLRFINPDKIASLVRGKRVIDTRNMLEREPWERAGFALVKLGEKVEKTAMGCTAWKAN